ncbi:unnamed protein product [Rhodiola kirilowii]
MTGSSSPCGACKFLRRKCVNGCVFAPYFSHEQGASQFSAIHKVFGASNVSKLLVHLPVNNRSEAALTISYEAQARVHDPIYGCISHIFALQQQVVNLQAQLAYLKQQAGQGQFHGPNSSTSPNWCNPGNPNLQHQNEQTQVFNQTHLTHLMNMASMESSENSTLVGAKTMLLSLTLAATMTQSHKPLMKRMRGNGTLRMPMILDLWHLGICSNPEGLRSMSSRS